MEITCRKCGARLTVGNTASPIIKCSNCGYPNPVLAASRSSSVVSQPFQGNFVSSNPAGNEHETKPLNPQANRPVPMELGWLVVHDENAEQQTYPLRIGRQIVGRKSISRPCDIMIETNDPYMGRNHCVLEVKPSRTGSYEYFLSDVKMSSGIAEQMSTNGTFVNAQPTALRPKDMVYLKDGDTIQMGNTKIVIKTLISAASAHDASRIVQETDYAQTVIIK